MAGIILITVPSIQYGGYFFDVLMKPGSGYIGESAAPEFFFRAGHAMPEFFVIFHSSVKFCSTRRACPAGFSGFARSRSHSRPF